MQFVDEYREAEVFTIAAQCWRGLGEIPESGLRLRPPMRGSMRSGALAQCRVNRARRRHRPVSVG